MAKPALVLHLLPILVSVGLLAVLNEWSNRPHAAAPDSAQPDLRAPLRGVTAYLAAPARPAGAQSPITLGLRN